MNTVNMRSKKTETDNSILVGMWANRINMVTTRKSYENQIEVLNESIIKELKLLILPICIRFNMPIEFIIESNRCVIQAKIYSSAKAKGSSFVTNISQSINPLSVFLSSSNCITVLPIAVEKAIRRIRKMTNSSLGTFINYNQSKTNNIKNVQDLKRKPDEPLLTITYNVRTRYDF